MVRAGTERGHRNGAVRRALLAVVPVVAVSVLGSAATIPNIPTWYAGLAKPPFTPPNNVFAPAWTTLYALMALAVWRILSAPADTPGRDRAVVVFFVQLALNALWSWSFFAAQSPLAGLVNILVLVPAIVATIVAFARIDRPAAWCLAPYLAWVLYATYLNAGVAYLNG